jgi:hypothetical protein
MALDSGPPSAVLIGTAVLNAPINLARAPAGTQ